MSGIESWSTTPANNNQAPPFGWPAGILPNQVEPIGRQMMASVAAWYQAAEWINYNFTITYSSATVFTVPGNATATFHVGRRVQATDGTTQVYGTITASVFTTLTTVTVSWDSGNLQTGVTIVYVGINSAIHPSSPSIFNVPITVNAPSSGNALSVNGAANSSAIQATGSSTSGQSFGISISAGTTSADFSFLITNLAQTISWFKVRGDGVVYGNDGTNLIELGYKDIPQNLQTTNYTTVMSDRGKGIDMNGSNLTATIAANASVAYPIGTVLVFTNLNATNLSVAINSDTLTLAGSTTTGTRTVTQNGVLSARKVTATSWICSGPGVS